MKKENKILGIGLAGLGILLLIILGLVKVNFDNQAVFLCEAIENDPNQTMAECPAHQNIIPWLLMGGFGISFLIFGAGVYISLFLKKDDKFPTKKQEEIDITNLDEEEKVVYLLAKQNDGSIYQSDLTKQSEFSKVKISRILDRLEGKNIIERKRRGMTNIVVLR